MITTEQFIEKFNLKYPDSKLNLMEYIYTGVYKKSTVICEKLHKTEMSANSLLNGNGCRKCFIERNTESKKYNKDIFIEKFNLKYPDSKLDLSNFEYSDIYSKGKVICEYGHIFYMRAGNLLNGGQKCKICSRLKNANLQKKSKESFLIELFKKYPDKQYWDFKSFEYLNRISKSNVTCESGHTFLQTPGKLLSGIGCPVCSSITTTKLINSNFIIKNTIENLNFYILLIYNKDEKFIKIGLTSKSTITERIRKNFPYEYKLILFNNLKFEEAQKLEEYIKSKYWCLKYKPLIRFDGRSECFTEQLLLEEEIINIFNL